MAQGNYQDRELRCAECGDTFVFSAGEQEFYASRGFVNDPKRCPVCRRARRSRRSGMSFGGEQGYRAPRQMYAAVCAQCGTDCEVPFQPRGDKPVYCNDCYRQIRSQQRY